MMSDSKPGRGADQFPMRFPEGMRDIIKKRADENGRSMNSELVAMLEKALNDRGEDTDHLYRELMRQDEEIARLKGTLEEWRVLYQGQVKNKNGFVSIMRSFCHQVLAAGGEVPDYIRELAHALLITANTNSTDAADPIDPQTHK